MTTTNTKKTPSAELGGTRAEGLENTPNKEMNTTMLPTAPAAVSTRIELDEQTTIDVDPSAAPWEHVEITITTRDAVFGEPRTTFGIALTPSEARQLASALLDGCAPAFGVADPQALEEHVAIARRLDVPTVAMTPAKLAAAMKEGRR